MSFFYTMDDLRYFFFFFSFFFSFFYGGGLSSSRWLFGTQLGWGVTQCGWRSSEARGPCGRCGGHLHALPATTPAGGRPTFPLSNQKSLIKKTGKNLRPFNQNQALKQVKSTQIHKSNAINYT